MDTFVLNGSAFDAQLWQFSVCTTVDYSSDSLHMHGQHIPLAAESAVIH